jgi:hypothetical protein
LNNTCYSFHDTFQGTINRTEFVMLMNAHVLDDDADDDEHIDSETLRLLTTQRKMIINLLAREGTAGALFLPTIMPSDPNRDLAPKPSGSGINPMRQMEVHEDRGRQGLSQAQLWKPPTTTLL